MELNRKYIVTVKGRIDIVHDLRTLCTLQPLRGPSHIDILPLRNEYTRQEIAKE